MFFDSTKALLCCRKVISKKHSLPIQAFLESAKHEKVIIIFSSHSLQMND